MSTVLITGGTGTIGKRLIPLILKNTEDTVVAVVREETTLPVELRSSRVSIISASRFIQMDQNAHCDELIHLAFARANKGNRAIAESLKYTEQVFAKAAEIGVKRMIYISSQGVYGGISNIRTVNDPPEPGSVYTTAKYAGELLLQSICAGKQIRPVILRLDNVIESQNLIKSLCRNAITQSKICLKGGKQLFSYISADDAANAIFLSYSTNLESGVYNVGPNEMRASLVDIGNIIVAVLAERGEAISVEFAEDDTQLWAGMDTSDFVAKTGWTPSKSLYEMITDIYLQSEKSIGEGNLNG